MLKMAQMLHLFGWECQSSWDFGEAMRTSDIYHNVKA
jgi:hypothetical protein